jgi:O-antigen ligase
MVLIFLMDVDSHLSGTALDLFKSGVFFWVLGFVYWVLRDLRTKNFSWIERLKFHSFYLISFLYLTYTYTQATIHLPPSEILGQKFYVRLFFYSGIFGNTYFYFRGETVRTFWFTLVFSTPLVSVWGFLISGTGFGPLLVYLLMIPTGIRIKISTQILIPLILVAFTVLSYSFHWNRAYHWNGIFLYFSMGYLIFLVSQSSKSTQKFAVKCFGFQQFLSVLVFLYFYILQGKLANSNTSLGSFQVNSVGGSLIFFIPILFYTVRRDDKFFTKTYLSIFALSTGFLLYFSHTRGAVLAYTIFTVSLVFILFLMKRKYLIPILMVLFLTILSPFVYEFFLKDKKIDTVFIRWEIWKLYLSFLWEKSPWVGIGFQSQSILPFFWTEIFKDGKYPLVLTEIRSGNIFPHSHNFWIQYFFEYGLLGILAISLIFAYILPVVRNILRKKSREPKILGLFFLSFLIHQSFDYTLQDPNVMFGISLFLGIFFGWGKFEIQFKNVRTDKYAWGNGLGFALGLVFLPIIMILHLNYKNFIVYQGSMKVDNFYRVWIRYPLPSEKVLESEKLKNKSLGFFLSDRMALLHATGIAIQIESGSLDQANLHSLKTSFRDSLDQCRRINPSNLYCKDTEMESSELLKIIQREKSKLDFDGLAK